MIYQGFSLRRKDLHKERGMTQWRPMQGPGLRSKLHTLQHKVDPNSRQKE